MDVESLAALDDDEVDVLHGLLRQSSIAVLYWEESDRWDVRELPEARIRATPAPGIDGVSHVVEFRYPGSHAIEGALFGPEVRGVLPGFRAPTGNAARDGSDRETDALLLAASRLAHADLLVTERSYNAGHPRVRGLDVCSPREALWAAGLFLRSRGQYVGYAGASGPIVRLNRGMQNWVAVRAALPAGWRWFSACLAMDHEGVHPELALLAQTAFVRVGRALVSRDQVVRAMSLPAGNDAAEDALNAMDVALIFSMAALDVAARVVNRVVDLPVEDHNVGWQKRDWVRQLGRSAPDLAALVARGSEGGDTLHAVRLLRNTVHGAGLQSMRVEGRLHPESTETVVQLPMKEADELHEIVNRRGWADDWGLRQMWPGAFDAEPDQLVDHLVRGSINLLNQLMLATPFGAWESAAQPQPERAGRSMLADPFAPPVQKSLLLQYGLGRD